MYPVKMLPKAVPKEVADVIKVNKNPLSFLGNQLDVKIAIDDWIGPCNILSSMRGAKYYDLSVIMHMRPILWCYEQLLKL